jgi:hypothetical protein
MLVRDTSGVGENGVGWGIRQRRKLFMGARKGLTLERRVRQFLWPGTTISQCILDRLPSAPINFSREVFFFMKTTEEDRVVHYHDGSWWFWMETYSDRVGPYPTREVAVEALMTYIEEKLGE